MQTDHWNDDDQDNTHAYLKAMFGERSGYVAVTFGHNPRLTKPRFDKDDWREKFYQWPQQYMDLIGDVDSALNHPDTLNEHIEVFICPGLRDKPSRRAGDNKPLMWVWADLDSTPTDDAIERINNLGAMSVLSGSEGHRHVYIPLRKPVNNVDHKALCRLLKDVIGAKDSKIAENDLLRLPGTLNWKKREATKVVIKRHHRAPRRTNGDLRDTMMDMVGPSKSWDGYRNKALASEPAQLGDVVDVPVPRLKKESKKCFAYQPTTDGTKRYEAIYKLITTMHEEGYSRDQIHVTLYEYPPAVSKWSIEKIARDVDRTLSKLTTVSLVETDDDIDDGDDGPQLLFHDWGSVVRRVESAPAPQYLFNGIWVEGDYGVLSAPDKSGKSWAMLDAAISAASGTAWMNRWECIASGPVIICFGEGSERKQIRRAKAVAASKGITGDEFEDLPIHPMFSVPQINDPDHLRELEDKIREVHPALVIIDPFYLAASGADSSNLVHMGTMLNKIQLVCQRHNAALMLSHHHNKSSSTNGNTDVHSRSSGVGLTAWGRVLISITTDGPAHTNASMKSSVSLEWNIKGDEIADQRVDMIREVWEDEPGDLSSDMNYNIIISDQVTAELSKPLTAVPTMEIVSEIIQSNAGGLTAVQIQAEHMEMKKRRIGVSTLDTVLKQLVLHSYIQEGSSRGNRKVPYLSIRPFTREDHEYNIAEPTTEVPTRKFDFGKLKPRTISTQRK